MRVTYWPNGNIQKIKHTVAGVLHNELGPAKLEFSSIGGKVYEEWVHHGVIHRVGGPAVRSWNDAGRQITEEWHFCNSLHREDGPAIRRWSDSGEITLEIWAIHGKLHRVGGPAYLSVGIIREEVWMRDGVEYREDDLPVEVVSRNGVSHYKWPMHPEYGTHRVGGPYIICGGDPEWWYKDCKYSFEDYWNIPENRKLNRAKVELLKLTLPLPIAEELVDCFWPDNLAKYAEGNWKI